MTRSWIHFTRGRFVRQARVGLGELREEHLSRQGFAGPVAMLYRTDGPNEVVRFEGEYRPRQIDSADVVSSDASDPRGGWQTLLSNEDVAVAISRRSQAMPYCYRDMEGDLLYFVHRGHGVFATEFGPIPYEPGDWVLCRRRRPSGNCPSPATACCWSSGRRSRSGCASTSRSAAIRRSTRPCWRSRTWPITVGRSRTNMRSASSMPAGTARFSTATIR